MINIKLFLSFFLNFAFKFNLFNNFKKLIFLYWLLIFFLASDLNFIFLFISLIYVFNCDSVGTTVEDARATAVAATATAKRGGGDSKAANGDGDGDSGGVTER